MSAAQLALALAAATAALLFWRWRTDLRGWTWPEWLGAALLLAAIYTVWRVAVTAALGTLASDWNGARLAPTFAMVYGYRLYYPATEGPVLNNVYGPVAALAYLPATVFRTPTPAILAGGALQAGFLFGAMLAFAWRAGGQAPADRRLALACGLGACLIMTRYPGSAYWISMVHADGPSLALGLLACAALITRDAATPTDRALAASAVAAILSCWAKQTAAPLPLALVAAVWLAHGRRQALRYLAMLAAVGVIVSAAFLLWFGRPLLFNMIDIVSAHAWKKPGLGGLATEAWRWLVSIRDLLALFAVALAVALLRSDRRADGARGAWVAPALAAVFLMPTGALGANKLGGEPSSFHSLYYLIAAIAALFAEAGRRAPAARALGWGFCVLAIAAAWQSGRCTPSAAQPPAWQNPNQLAYELALRHPGEVYYPWHPLASLLAEGRLYHFEYGLIDRYIGGHEATPDHFRANLPPRLRWVASPVRGWSLTHYLGDFSQDTPMPDLPGWIVRQRPVSRDA
jgi:hypothetical protein